MKKSVKKKKLCSKCGEHKSNKHFFERQPPRTGYLSQCKECRKNIRKKKYKENIKWRRHHIDWTIQYKRKNKEKAKIWDRKSRLKAKYGISLIDFNKMMKAQNKRCAICSEAFTHGKKTCVDHNHKTGKVRQLLCSFCNSGLGYFKENTKILINAVNYIDKWN